MGGEERFLTGTAAMVKANREKKRLVKSSVLYTEFETTPESREG